MTANRPSSQPSGGTHDVQPDELDVVAACGAGARKLRPVDQSPSPAILSKEGLGFQNHGLRRRCGSIGFQNRNVRNWPDSLSSRCASTNQVGVRPCTLRVGPALLPGNSQSAAGGCNPNAGSSGSPVRQRLTPPVAEPTLLL